MRDSNGQEKPTGQGRDGDQPEDSPSDLMAEYTPRQRETFQRGLRIWARVAVRSYIRRKEAESQISLAEGGEEDQDDV